MSAMKERISSLWTYGCSLWMFIIIAVICETFFIPKFFLIEQGIVFDSFNFVWFVVGC